MIFGIGVDSVDIDRFEDYNLRSNSNVIFTKKELEYCLTKPKPSQHLAARFAGKEAIVKAFNSVGLELMPGNIEILNDEKGRPEASISEEKLREFNIKISISHSKNLAVGFSIVVKKE